MRMNDQRIIPTDMTRPVRSYLKVLDGYIFWDRCSCCIASHGIGAETYACCLMMQVPVVESNW